MAPLKDLAIKHALQNNWQEAIEANQQLLEENPSDIDTLNRLAFAYLKSNHIEEAKECYSKVLQLDATNPIALKNLKKIDTIALNGNPVHSNGKAALSLENLFIEEAGKTKVIELKNITDKKTLSNIQPGDSVKLVIKRSKIFVQTPDATYIGMLPDQMGARLISLIQGGNEYQAYIKGLSEKSVTIFVKEIKRSKKFKDFASFSTVNV